jgi:malate dehydrogenase (oxaloacetate-decarboxylating)(NADP+)
MHLDCEKLVRYNSNTLASCLVAHGEADGIVTGLNKNISFSLEQVSRVINPMPNKKVMGLSIIVSKKKAVIVSDTLGTEYPEAHELAVIARQSACVARRLGFEPRVALLSYSTFGHPDGVRMAKVRDAVKILTDQGADFEFDGEMAADVALNAHIRKEYPFTMLKGDANVLVMPAIHSANIATKMVKELGGATIIGPLLYGLEHSVQLIPVGATVSDILNMAVLAAYNLNS